MSHTAHGTILLTMKNEEELEADAKVSLEAIELGTAIFSFCDDDDDDAVAMEDVISDPSAVDVVVFVAVVEGAATICLTLVVVASVRRAGGNSELEISIIDES